jgi:16S rRNA (cytosine1402-N4)-methyltransferase
VTESYHQPVLVREVLEILQPRPGDVLVDCNLGSGGHALALLEESGGEAFLVGLDLDAEMIETARQRFGSQGIPSRCYALVQADHANLARVLGALGRSRADKILLDLGASSLHYDRPGRGFSCTVEGPLDMRYDRSGGGATAADIVNEWSERDLARLFRVKGDERWAGRIARRLVERRAERPFETTGDLAGAIGAAIPRKAWPPKMHPGTRCFLALRVEVNHEDRSLAQGLEAGLAVLAPGGRMAVLTFQSHEDKVVKECFRRVSRDEVDEVDPMGRIIKRAEFRDLTRRPLRPSAEEELQNPRSRSTKLRAVEKMKSEE